MGSDCLFCKIGAGEIPSKKIYEDEKTLAFLDINPAGIIPGHTLVIPKKHFDGIEDCSLEDLAAVMNTIKKVIPAVKEVSGATGINILRNEGKVAGELIHHLHFHIIPRTEDDGIRFEENRHSASEEALKNTQKKMISYFPSKK